MHTMEAFLNNTNNREFIIVLPSESIEEWKKLCQLHHFQIEHKIAEDGPKRFHSVKSGLKISSRKFFSCNSRCCQAFVSKETIQRCFEMAARKGNAIPAVNFTESVREISGVSNKILTVQNYELFKHLRFSIRAR